MGNSALEFPPEAYTSPHSSGSATGESGYAKGGACCIRAISMPHLRIALPPFRHTALLELDSAPQSTVDCAADEAA